MLNFILRNRFLDTLIVAILLIPLLCFGTSVFVKTLDHILFQTYLEVDKTSIVQFTATGDEVCFGLLCKKKKLVNYDNTLFLDRYIGNTKKKRQSFSETLIFGKNQNAKAYYHTEEQRVIFVSRDSFKTKLVLFVIAIFLFYSCILVVYVYYPSLFMQSKSPTFSVSIRDKRIKTLFLSIALIPIISFLSLPLYSAVDELLIQKKASAGELVELDNKLFQQKQCFFFCDKFTSFSYKKKIYFSATGPFTTIFNRGDELKGYKYNNSGHDIIVPYKEKKILYTNIIIASLMYIFAIYLMLKFPRVIFFYQFKKKSS